MTKPARSSSSPTVPPTDAAARVSARGAHSRGPLAHIRSGSLGALVAAAVSLALCPTADAASGRTARPPAAAAPAPAPAECRAGEASFFRDEGLRAKLFAKLQFNKQLLREQIDVHVNGGVATLSGGVSTADHIALAGKLAREVSGVSCVNNLLRVGPPTPPPERVVN